MSTEEENNQIVSSQTATSDVVLEEEEDTLLDQMLLQTQPTQSEQQQVVQAQTQTQEAEEGSQYTAQQLEILQHYANYQRPDFDDRDEYMDEYVVAALTEAGVQAKSDIYENLVDSEIFHTTGGVFHGDDEDSIIVGGDGNNTINGEMGDDLIIGGLGGDVLRGHEDNDILFADNYLFGDLNGDDVVNQDDTDLWNANLGEKGVIYLPGDFNESGRVDGSDFLAWMRNPGMGSLGVWEANYGRTGTDGIKWVPGDSNFDGVVDVLDQPIWAATIENMNDSVPSTAGDQLYGGAGDDFLYAGMGHDHLWGGSGADTFVATEVQFFLFGATFVRDFNSAEGDVLDISNIISGYDPMEDMLSDFISLQDRAGTVDVSDMYINVDGTGGSQGYATIEITGLYGFGSGASESQLQNLVDNGILIV